MEGGRCGQGSPALGLVELGAKESLLCGFLFIAGYGAAVLADIIFKKPNQNNGRCKGRGLCRVPRGHFGGREGPHVGESPSTGS